MDTSPTLATPTVTGNMVVEGYLSYNTVDHTTNYERFEMAWGGDFGANVFGIRAQKAGTGTARRVAIAYGGTSSWAILIPAAASSAINLASNGSSSVFSLGRVRVGIDTPGVTATSGTSYGLLVQDSFSPTATSTMVGIPIHINPTINYSNGTPGAGSYEALKISAVETALPTGTNYLIRASAGSAGTTDKFGVLNTGATIAPSVGPSTTQQHTLPAVTSDTVALLSAAQTLAAKTIDGLMMTNTVPTLSYTILANYVAYVFGLVYKINSGVIITVNSGAILRIEP